MIYVFRISLNDQSEAKGQIKNRKSRHNPCPDWLLHVTVTCKTSYSTHNFEMETILGFEY